ncbi:MAG: hypothetical protein GC150_08525 [Rhizobiales bacterium]|nr:hypothetical protein [Hyphomicrobiales bacterium]
MLVLLFEVVPHPGHEEHYLERAAQLRPRLAAHPGLLFLERYRSLRESARILSHQLWATEQDLAAWRADGPHRRAQSDGRNVHFADYRIRVATVLARQSVSPLPGTGEASGGSADVGENGGPAPARLLLVLASEHGTPDADAEGDHYRSIYETRRHVTIRSVAGFRDGNEGLVRHMRSEGATAAMLCRVERDYGLHERREAPQTFPPPVGAG